ncbi:MAG: helix-turn-helix domain-containing protein [Planctomycetota bacterium]|nr:helix-turn-helix domain-containing protein [Planctomycetota bacterium]MCZ7604668.1 helix-turn-helix domain-containing protein [Planctomycetota bacterium]MCZ7605195.1 helix-turn-helix domain-containing protein [Planctomycetota bacterium]MCZ7606497.1 helix-turn-helix domain-containing protein [Planctomycetota bacterium]MCZ7606619.1 helix-turn-helix domain-containing protein [Planctomycetota bacterium]
MPGPAPEVTIVLSDAERVELEKLRRSGTAEARLSRRARIVLLAADGEANSAISQKVGLDRECVIDWRRRYAQGGIIALHDKPRSGRPPTFSPSAQALAAGPGLHAAV